MALTQDAQVLRPWLGHDHLAAAIEEEARVVSKAGAELQHRPAREVEAKRGKVLLPAVVVAKVVRRPEDRLGCCHRRESTAP
jgi:hypothetical protein